MREIVTCFDRAFDDLHDRSKLLMSGLTDDQLYRAVAFSKNDDRQSVGELILRSAAAVEQMAGGITTRLWDDPFEWTLPEQLPSVNDVLDYLETVAMHRKKAFEFIRSDSELYALIPAPVKLTPLFSVLLDTLAKAERFFGKAYVLANADF